MQKYHIFLKSKTVRISNVQFVILVTLKLALCYVEVEEDKFNWFQMINV